MASLTENQPKLGAVPAPRITSAYRFVVAVLLFLAISQALLFTLTGTPASRITGIALSVATVALTCLPGVATRFRLPGMWLAAAGIIVNLGWAGYMARPLYSDSLLEAGVVLGYGGLLVAAALTVTSEECYYKWLE